MIRRAANPLAPSSTLALYLAAIVAVYVVRDPITTITIAAIGGAVALIGVRLLGGAIPSGRWRGSVMFIAWVFIMRGALDLAGGDSLHDAHVWMRAGAQAARVAVLIVGALAMIAVTPARAVVDELESTPLPRSLRLLVMMLVQYPRVLRDRYDQIVEAQIARGANRPRTLPQRITHGVRVLLPVMQSELNAVGERAGLIHLRGLDLDVVVADDARARTLADVAALIGAIGVVVLAIVVRFGVR